MTELRFNEGFPAADETAWRALVDKALKGGDFEKRLVSRTADGLAIRPSLDADVAQVLANFPRAVLDPQKY